jgi:formamidopyrimidine-DNA glycosylase
MPELPEVETTVRGIAPFLTEQTFRTVRIHQPSLRWPIPASMTVTLPGALCHGVRRRAKYLIFETSRGDILAHLGMSGSFRLSDPETARKHHDHIEIDVGDFILRYHDPRRFGCFLWLSDARAQALLATLGPEPWDDALTGRWLYTQATRRQVAVKNFIMSNAVVVGVGNIYASESLFLAGIHPNRAACRISEARYEVLSETIRTVLARAIDSGGTTLRDFVNGQGAPGYFQQTLQVYGRAGEPCRQCQTPIQSRVIGGRNSYFCKRCQR